MIKLALFLLLLSAPLLSGSPYLGVPQWVWASLGATLAFAGVILWLIEKRWDTMKAQEPLDG